MFIHLSSGLKTRASPLLAAGFAAFLLPQACGEGPNPSPLEQAELQFLNLYLEGLKTGNPSSASAIEKLDGCSFPCVLRAIEVYASLPEGTAEETHRAFQELLYRLSKASLHPFSLLELYDAAATAWVTRPLIENPAAQALFNQLLTSGIDRISYELAIRLTPEASLLFLEKELAQGVENSRRPLEILAAWNRRLDTSPESRPIPGLEKHLKAISGFFSPERPAEWLEEHLLFIGHWSSLRADYVRHLKLCLLSDKAETVQAGLQAQRAIPAHLDLNESILQKFAVNDEISEKTIRNYAFDSAQNHSAALRRIWGNLLETQLRRKYFCLYAMGVHPAGNEDLALESILSGEFSLFEVGLLVLLDAAEEKAREAVSFILHQSPRGHEEALRFARGRGLKGFGPRALEVLRNSQDQIVKQAALYYLQLADGPAKRHLLELLAHSNDDIRLAAIQVFSNTHGLSEEEKNEFGIALARVFLQDKSPGHQQEALFVLALWKDERARPVFAEVLAKHPSKFRPGRPILEEDYWDYRFRLVALLGMAKLGGAAALEELRELHRAGGPQERLDALLAFTEIGQTPPTAFSDLFTVELRLASVAAELIATCGSEPEKEKMRQLFAHHPFWKMFAVSGLRHQGLLRHVGLSQARKGFLYE